MPQKNGNDYYGLRFDEFVVPLVKAVQELNDKFEEQKLANSKLIEIIDELKMRNEHLLLIITAAEKEK